MSQKEAAKYNELFLPPKTDLNACSKLKIDDCDQHFSIKNLPLGSRYEKM